MSYSGDGEHNREADQRRRDLARAQLLVPALRERPVDRTDQIQLREEVRGQQQRPDLATHPDHRRVQPRERAHQLLELARRLELVLAAQRAQHAMAHPPVLIAIRLHQAQIHVAFPAPHHGVTLDIHVGPTISNPPDGTANHRFLSPEPRMERPADHTKSHSQAPVLALHHDSGDTSPREHPQPPLGEQAGKRLHKRRQRAGHHAEAAENAASGRR